MNYFEFYPGDYLRDTTRLTLVEHGAFLRLLMAYYAEEEPLPAEHAELFVIVSAVTATDKAAVRKVADRFFPVGEDGLRRNGRADAEIAKAQKRMATSRENGGKGGRPKKPAQNPSGIPAGNPLGFENGGFSEPSGNPPETCSGEALQTPDPTSQERAFAPPADPPLPARGPLPPNIDPDAWALFEAHHREQRRWSIARQTVAIGQLRQLTADGLDANAVLTWATTRGLADLADAARRMAADAAKEANDANRPRPGESHSARSERINRDLDERDAG
jgi:uncharacterized protein YdaU (DUF1376 family)